MKRFLFILTVFISFYQLSAQTSSPVITLSIDEFKEAIAIENVQLVDVRTPEEFKEGAIDGAINIDYFQQETFEKEFEKLDKTKPIYIYCKSGNRSQKSSVILDTLGFNEIYELQGGYTAWADHD
ncbi:Rhodanese-related sulfurtransferase [Nonlabens sp. Hel1_33_55]|uniref:rhodanese-like domain-containing protein n=1 Tax=Nonlabens sp. Hel1_33_55 TaxID=1336802 RepID=UPI000875AA3C|nr:rhodanese-like domain-containing protein [Nonlabens sp. Hel1_33_55]SCY23638.1 Rhodanese-related sulfurtransferase [Nonlabens sp. Hel1_33_55]